jgi:hypothetical protein
VGNSDKRAVTPLERLQVEVDSLRNELSEALIATQSVDQVGNEVSALRAEMLAEAEITKAAIASLQTGLDEIRKVLVGNDGSGTVDILTGLMATVEQLGRLYGEKHQESEYQNEVIASLIPKMKLEEVWRSIAEMWQAYAVAQFATQRQDV